MFSCRLLPRHLPLTPITQNSLQLTEVPIPTPGPGELLLRMRAAALNHRDHFIRQHLYPGIDFANPLLADGCGVVVGWGADPTSSTVTSASSGSTGDRSPQSHNPHPLLNKLVLVTPSRGWASSLHGPESESGTGTAYTVVGATKLPGALGTAQTYLVVPETEVEPAPPHLSATEAAALPLAGLTAWRAIVTKGGCGVDGLGKIDFDAVGPVGLEAAAKGRNVLVTGIGGGVAVAACQLAVAMGCNVWVTSGEQAKVDRAVRELGAKGGVVYKDTDWEKQLAALLPRERPFLDSVVDGAGADDLVSRVVRMLRPGAAIVQYGMTTGPRMDWPMATVMRNIELRGSTGGSRREFAQMVRFVDQKKIRPVVGRVVNGLDDLAAIESLFKDMEAGRQFGKLVIEISGEDGEEDAKEAKL